MATMITDAERAALNRIFQTLIQDVGYRADALGSAGLGDILAQVVNQHKDVIIYVDPVNGSDANDGSSATPVKTFEQATDIVPATWFRRCEIHLAPGVHYLTNPGNYSVKGSGMGAFASPMCVVGSFTNEYGTRTVTTASAIGSDMIDASIAGLLRSGTGLSFVAGAAAGKVRLNVTSGYTVADINKFVHISGAASDGNNGDHEITAVVPGSYIELTNNQSVQADANNGSISFLESLTGCWVSFLTAANPTNLGVQRAVRDNTTTDVQLSRPFPAATVAGDTFIISRCASSLVPAAVSSTITPTRVINFVSPGVLGFRGIKFVSFGAPIVFSGFQFYLAGCEVALNGGSLQITEGNGGFTAVIASMNPTYGVWLNSGVNNPFAANATAANVFTQPGDAVFIHNGTLAINNSKVSGHYVFRNLNADASVAVPFGAGTTTNSAGSSTLALCYVDAFRSTIVGFSGSIVTHSAQANYFGRWTGQRSASDTGMVICVQSQIMGFDHIDMNNALGDVFHLQNSTASLGAVTSSLSGSKPNAGYGISADKGSYVNIDGNTAAGLTSVTGTLGAVHLGRTTTPNVKTYANVRTADGSGVVGVMDAYLNRVEVVSP